MTNKILYLNINKSIKNNILNINNINQNLYKKLRLNSNKIINKNLYNKKKLIFNKKISQNLYKKLELIFNKKKSKV